MISFGSDPGATTTSSQTGRPPSTAKGPWPDRPLRLNFLIRPEQGREKNLFGMGVKGGTTSTSTTKLKFIHLAIAPSRAWSITPARLRRLYGGESPTSSGLRVKVFPGVDGVVREKSARGERRREVLERGRPRWEEEEASKARA